MVEEVADMRGTYRSALLARQRFAPAIFVISRNHPACHPPVRHAA
jgi:hypothetical protein